MKRVASFLWRCLIITVFSAFPNPLQALQPNILLIMTDDLGYGDLGCYGQTNIQTPHLDRLASEGMRWTQFYAGSTVCAPSRCVLMTGQHTGHAEIRGNREIQPMGQWPLADETLTIAEVLKASGYRTALIGKWGLGGPNSSGHPNRQGFDEFFGYLCQRHAHNYYPEFLYRNDQRVPLSGNVVNNERGDGAGYAAERALYSHDLCTSEALQFLDNQDAQQPFFLFLSLTIPHANNEGGTKGMEVPDLGIYANKDWPAAQKGHAAMISRMDADIGRLLDRLRQKQLDEQTLVLFTSDNGPHREGGNDPLFNDSNGPLRGIKRDLYEGGIRVPLIARWKGRIKAGSHSDHVGYFGDFMATVADLTGSRLPESYPDSLSFLPTLIGKPQPTHEALYWEFHGGGQHLAAIRQGNWKGIAHRNGVFELFDLEHDLGETTNVAADHLSKVANLRHHMDAAHQDHALWPIK
ncbi:MAG: N-acetylgalactosamine-6-sulfatase [Verrucomicrobia bacterium]|jgi:arylsulfatase A-like enzyme|nr:N-acetylgalactosamine-6-sulfatase [Verrucomicrobiota bacterium]